MGEVPGITEPEPPDSLTRTTIRGIGLAGSGYLASVLLNFVAYLVLVRLLTPRDFGLYAAGTLITGIGGLFAESGMLAALIKREDRLDEAASTAAAALAVTGTALMLVSLAASPLIGLVFHSAQIGAVTAVLSGWLLIRALTIVPDALLQRRFSFLRRVVVDPLGAIAYAAAAIPLAASGAGVWAMVAGAYASITIEAVAAWFASGFRPQRRLVSFAMWRELAAFSRPLVAGEVVRRVSSQIDVFTLGRFSGAAALGQYRNGLMLISQPGGLFSQVAAYVILPAFARLSAVPERMAAAARQAYWATASVVVPMALACLPLGVPVAVTLLGPRWRPAGHAFAALAGMLLAGTLLSISAELMKAMGALSFQFRVHVAWLVLVALTVIPSGIIWGLLGVAIALSLSSCVAAGYAIIGIARRLDIPPPALFGPMLRPLLASLPMIGAMLAFASGVALLHHRELGRVLLLVAEILLGALVYVGVVCAIDPGRRRMALGLARRARTGALG